MSKVFKRQKNGQGNGARRRKSISFDPNRNKVSFIRVPPRSRNADFWFSERQRMVTKGLNFEVEPFISVQLTITSRLRLGAIVYPAEASATGAGASGSDRAYLEVMDEEPLLQGMGGAGSGFPVGIDKGSDDDSDDGEVSVGESGEGRWCCVGSVPAGGMAKLQVTLPPGEYKLRCVGATRPVCVFCQAWDVERELF